MRGRKGEGTDADDPARNDKAFGIQRFPPSALMRFAFLFPKRKDQSNGSGSYALQRPRKRSGAEDFEGRGVEMNPASEGGYRYG